MRILVMGLPGSGKTWLSEKLAYYLNAVWLNADRIREMVDDWEFSEQARIRQASRMRTMADFEIINRGGSVVCDFVCPTDETRNTFDADILIFMDTIKKGRFEDTNLIFEPPYHYDYIVTKNFTMKDVMELANQIKAYREEIYNEW